MTTRPRFTFADLQTVATDGNLNFIEMLTKMQGVANCAGDTMLLRRLCAAKWIALKQGYRLPARQK